MRGDLVKLQFVQNRGLLEKSVYFYVQYCVISELQCLVHSWITESRKEDEKEIGKKLQFVKNRGLHEKSVYFYGYVQYFVISELQYCYSLLDFIIQSQKDWLNPLFFIISDNFLVIFSQVHCFSSLSSQV